MYLYLYYLYLRIVGLHTGPLPVASAARAS